MISRFLSRLLLGSQADFLEEHIRLLNLFFLMCPIESYLTFQLELEKQLEEKCKNVMVALGRNISDAIVNSLNSRFKTSKDNFKTIWLDFFSLTGFGKLQVVEFKDRRAVFQIDSNELAKHTLAKKTKFSPCLVICGMLEGYMKSMTGKAFVCEEKTCISKNQKFCSFELK